MSYQLQTRYQSIEKKSIELICTANQGRSVPGEIFCQERIEELGLSHKYQAISSGTGVDSIRQGKQSIDFKKSIMKVGIERSIYGPNTDDVTSLLDLSAEDLNSEYERNPSRINSYFDQAVKQFKEEELEDRKEALSKYQSGDKTLESRIKPQSEQTVARKDTIAVLTMDKRTYDAAKKIYEAKGYDSSVVHLLKEYATGEVGAEVPNAFGKGKDVYMNMIPELRALARIAVDKAIEENESNETLGEKVEEQNEGAKSEN
jgi:protein-tyrosine-phosphatase